MRTITDLCWADLGVRLLLRVRRFVCSNQTCPRRTFAERPGQEIKADARRTRRCTIHLQKVGLLLAGNAGARLAQFIGLPIRSDTLLRLVRAIIVPTCSPPEILGIDDFALRKGIRYGTLLVDLQNQRLLVDILPDREKTTGVDWLKRYPQITTISRDRGMTYAQAAREALPEAIQIADRFHLSQNLGERLQRILRRLHPTLQEIFGKSATRLLDSSLALKRWEEEKQVSQERRMAVYEHVLALAAQGYIQMELADQLHMGRQRVRHYLKEPPTPPIYKQRSTKLAPHKSYLTRRFVEEGCENSLLAAVSRNSRPRL